MLRKTVLVLAGCLTLASCASDKPKIVQAVPGMPEVRLTTGMATQIEVPGNARVQSATVGNPNLVTAERDGNIVNLMPKDGSGETNVIVRATDSDGDSKLYQYRVIVQPQ